MNNTILQSRCEDLSLKLAELLIQLNWQMVTAESCTGGQIATTLTELSGCSQWFAGGWVTYSNQMKQECLGVTTDALSYGAVSRQVVENMALGAVKAGHANFGVSVSGVAGPQGGTSEKPVGCVWLGWLLENPQSIPLDRINISQSSELVELNISNTAKLPIQQQTKQTQEHQGNILVSARFQFTGNRRRIRICAVEQSLSIGCQLLSIIEPFDAA